MSNKEILQSEILNYMLTISLFWLLEKKNEGYVAIMVGIFHSSDNKSSNSEMEITFDLSNYESYSSDVERTPVLPGISDIKEHTIVFDNEDEHQFEAIYFASGYKNISTK
uniref:Uncharacterized protein n=1 Tax=Solanum lycopersicum TaxID=4081 RepID=A0A3Q7FFH8_SOLLC